MSDNVIRVIAGALTVAAAITLLPGFPAAIGVPVVIAFAFVAPGLAASRFVPSVDMSDRLALTAALSVSFMILVSLLLVAMSRWTGSLTFAELACITTALIAFPQPLASPGSQQETAVDAEPVDRAGLGLAGPRPLSEIHRKARSEDPAQRRQGLVELALVLEAEGESDWAAEVLAQARELSPS